MSPRRKSAMQVRKAAVLADAADVPCWVQMGGLCTGVMAAYSVHLQATLPNATLLCDELPFTSGGRCFGRRVGAGEGALYRATGSGLGIKVEMEVVERYRVAEKRKTHEAIREMPSMQRGVGEKGR